MKYLNGMMAMAILVSVGASLQAQAGGPTSGAQTSGTQTQSGTPPQSSTQKPNTSKPAPPPPPVASPDYLIGPGDVLRIDVVDEAAYSGDFVVRPDGTTLEDMASKNGKFLDGRRVNDPVPLPDDAEIRLGAACLRFRRSRFAERTDTLSSEH